MKIRSCVGTQQDDGAPFNRDIDHAAAEETAEETKRWHQGWRTWTAVLYDAQLAVHVRAVQHSSTQSAGKEEER